MKTGGITMKNLLINNELKCVYSDGFHEMTGDELKKYFLSDENRCGIYDESRHFIISVSWIKKNFFTFITDAKSVVNGAEYRLKKNLVNYRRVDRMKCEIAGKKADGIRYEYTAVNADVEQIGELYVFRHHHMFYFVHLAARQDNFEESRRELTELLRSMTFIG